MALLYLIDSSFQPPEIIGDSGHRPRTNTNASLDVFRSDSPQTFAKSRIPHNSHAANESDRPKTPLNSIGKEKFPTVSISQMSTFEVSVWI